uniref:Uncharacterized protein n=1 Tax=Oryza punctata TaxID=4537 RepID=A0A0E0L1W3_ORYPU
MATEILRSERLILGGRRGSTATGVTDGGEGHDLGGIIGAHGPDEQEEAPVVRSSLAAKAAVGNQPNPFALGGPTKYPADDRERNLLLIKFLRSTAATVSCHLQVNDGLSWIADLASPNSN